MFKKNRNSTLRLDITDSGNSVKATLTADNYKRFEYVNDDTNPIRVRSALPEKNSFIKSAKHWAKKNIGGSTIDQQLNTYVSCREKEIFEQVQGIRKSLKRINRQIECIALAKKYIHEYKSKRT